jgi:hypothetical protein
MPEMYPGDGLAITCDEGPYAAKCPKCIDGFWNNRTIGYYPDACERMCLKERGAHMFAATASRNAGQAVYVQAQAAWARNALQH